MSWYLQYTRSGKAQLRNFRERKKFENDSLPDLTPMLLLQNLTLMLLLQRLSARGHGAA
jgi:hypothetical protein